MSPSVDLNDRDLGSLPGIKCLCERYDHVGSHDRQDIPIAAVNHTTQIPLFDVAK